LKTKALLASLLLFAWNSNSVERISFPVTDERPNILFLIADDWSFPHAGILGDALARTPTFDYLAANGALFTHAFCASPSCSPSRASILTGKYPHQLGAAANLWSVLPESHPNWMSILEQAGYHTGKGGKGWGPGNFEAGGYDHNPAGQNFDTFHDFLDKRKPLQPFAYWFGSSDPHRPYEANSGVKSGMDPGAVNVPGFLPDAPCVRNDLLDYYYEVERFDRECGALLRQLAENGMLDNTLIVMTSDNGMPFPRAKANLYDYGTRMPLAVFWKGKVAAGLEIDSFINFIDFAPTFLDAAGLGIPPAFSGKSLMGLLLGTAPEAGEEVVFLERERHANVRKGDLGYPMRAVRTKKYLYIRNFEEDRWPAGDPKTHQSVGQFGDIDNSVTKYLMMNDSLSPLYKLAFAQRPAEELYDLSNDPYTMMNLASDPGYGTILKDFRNTLLHWMRDSQDRRYNDPGTPFWDEAWYTPDYQFYDFNLEAELSAYEMIRRDAVNSFSAYPCLP
jgi:arylsulfatase A-like enzyme